MIEELIKDKVYYKIFNLTHETLTHKYIIKNPNDLKQSEQIKENKKIILKEFNADKLLLLNQVHGNDVISDESFSCGNSPTGDALVTNNKNIVLGIITADCVPVLFTSKNGKIIGAAHCGWRSAKANIIAKTIKIMKQKGELDLQAIIGPSIAQNSYEVSQDFYEDFINQSVEYKIFFIPSIKKGHYMFDLSAFVRYKLAEEKVEIIKHINEDTYSMKEKYPSFRRSVHTGELYNQNILSAIMMK